MRHVRITQTPEFKREFKLAKEHGVICLHSVEIDPRGHWVIAREDSDYWLQSYRSMSAAIRWATKRGLDVTCEAPF